MIGKDVELIEYSKHVDIMNAITHGLGVVFGVFGSFFLIIRADGLRENFAVIIYGIALSVVYTVSTVYHSLKKGEAKRIARIVDHSAIPLLIAGTATPCALIILFDVSIPHGVAVFCLAWLCTIFGLFSKIFFFEKLKAFTMGVYVACCSVMLIIAVPLLGKIDIGDFLLMLTGCAFYGVGAILVRLGRKYEILHPIFHVVVLIGSAFHYYVIFNML